MSGGGRSSGAILIAVLWAIAFLSGLAMAAATTFRGFAGIVTVHRDKAQADALFTAGLEVAAGIVGRLGEAPLPEMQGELALSGGRVRFRLSDEGGRIDAGKAPVELLASLFRSLGARDADGIAQRIVAWRSPDAAGAPPPETGQATPEAEWPFSDVRQLARIPGVPPDLVAAAAPLLTVYGTATVNPLTAPPAVIAALPGIEGPRLRLFLDARQRLPTDAQRLQALLAPAQQHLGVSARKVASVRLAARLDDGFEAAAEAVVAVFPDDREPYRILSWKPLGSEREDRPRTSK